MIPGPGKYKYQNKGFGKEGKLYSFGKEEKFCDKRPLTPGPNCNTDDKTRSKISRIESAKGCSGNNFNNTIYRYNNYPGPASYDTTKSNKANTPAFR